MKGIVITSHGPLAQGLLESSKLFFGDQPQLTACCLNADDNPDEFVEVLQQAIKEVDTGDGVFVFCDILFGTPCNCMARIAGLDLNDDKLQVITGVNLPMILQILAVREGGDVEVSDMLNSGKDAISDLKEILKANLS